MQAAWHKEHSDRMVAVSTEILQTVIRELGKVLYDYEVPIIMEILPVSKIEHVIARTTGENNKGIEAAQATIDIISLYRQMDSGL